MEWREVETNRIVLPEEHDKTKFPSQFIIKYLGPQCKEVRVGDGVVVSPEAIVKFPHGGRDYFLTREENVGAVIREMDKR